MPKGEHLRARRRTMYDCQACGWGASRYPGSVKPCPDCGGPVVARSVEVGQRIPRGKTKPLRVRLTEAEIAELADMAKGGSPTIAAEQVVRAVLARRRAKRLAAKAG